MGIAAAKKHMTDPKTDKKCKHNKRMEDLRGMKRDCFASKQSDNEPPASSVSCSETILQSSNQSFAQSELKTISDEVWQSQTLWALNVVHTHQTLNSAGNKGDLFRAMFPDSMIAKEFNKLSRGKLSYMINHGLAPYFKNQIMLKLSPKAPRLPPKFMSSFDESLNTVSCSKQMDVHVSYYDENLKRVERVYLNSQFMGHGTAHDIMNEFKKPHKDLDIVNNLIQLSMDGPNVNWAFLDTLEEYRKTEDPNAPTLINIGSFGLHVLHGAYKTSLNETDWELDKTLKAAHDIFKKSPARQADYLSANADYLSANVHEEWYDDKLL